MRESLHDQVTTNGEILQKALPDSGEISRETRTGYVHVTWDSVEGDHSILVCINGFFGLDLAYLMTRSIFASEF